MQVGDGMGLGEKLKRGFLFYNGIRYLHLQKYFLESFRNPNQKFKCRIEEESFKRR